MFLLENSFRPVLKRHGFSCHNVTRRSSSAHVHSAAAIFVVNFVARGLASIRAWRHVCREHVVEVGIFLLLRLMIFFDGDWCRPSQLHSGHKKVGNWFVPDYRGSGAAWSKKGSRRLICVVAMSTWGHLYTRCSLAYDCTVAISLTTVAIPFATFTMSLQGWQSSLHTLQSCLQLLLSRLQPCL